MTLDSFGARGTLGVSDDRYRIWQLAALEGLGDVARLPYSIKILLENLLRHEDGTDVSSDHIAALSRWPTDAGSVGEVAFSPERVLLQDRGSSWQNSGVHEPARCGTLTGLLSAQVGLPRAEDGSHPDRSGYRRVSRCCPSPTSLVRHHVYRLPSRPPRPKGVALGSANLSLLRPTGRAGVAVSGGVDLPTDVAASQGGQASHREAGCADHRRSGLRHTALIAAATQAQRSLGLRRPDTVPDRLLGRRRRLCLTKQEDGPSDGANQSLR